MLRRGFFWPALSLNQISKLSLTSPPLFCSSASVQQQGDRELPLLVEQTVTLFHYLVHATFPNDRKGENHIWSMTHEKLWTCSSSCCPRRRLGQHKSTQCLLSWGKLSPPVHGVSCFSQNSRRAKGTDVLSSSAVEQFLKTYFRNIQVVNSRNSLFHRYY